MTDVVPRPEPLWSALGLVAPLEARVSRALPSGGVTGLSVDTRSLARGDLFFALDGRIGGGHPSVPVAFARGAAAAVVAEARAAECRDAGPMYVVHDVAAAIERLARAARARSKARIIAVTGSVGKSTTKEALRLLLAEEARTYADDSPFDPLDSCLALARLPAAARFAVFEIGLDRVEEIGPLAALIRPHVAVVSTIGPVRLGHFGSLEAVVEAAARIFAHLEENGEAVLYREAPLFQSLRELAEASSAGRIITFGESEDADIRLIDLALAADHSDVTADIGGKRMTYQIGAPGKHLVIDSLAALAAARAAGAEWKYPVTALTRWVQPEGRGGRLQLRAAGGAFTVIDDSHRTDPLSLRVALALLAQTAPGWLGRRIAVISDMPDLGAEASDMHVELAKAVAESRADMVFAAGPLMQSLFDALPEKQRGGWAAHAADLAAELINVVHGGDVVLLKGSNASRMPMLAAALKQRFATPAAKADRR